MAVWSSSYLIFIITPPLSRFHISPSWDNASCAANHRYKARITDVAVNEDSSASVSQISPIPFFTKTASNLQHTVFSVCRHCKTWPVAGNRNSLRRLLGGSLSNLCGKAIKKQHLMWHDFQIRIDINMFLKKYGGGYLMLLRELPKNSRII